jgi:multiple sugar transport system substrate-binding protein
MGEEAKLNRRDFLRVATSVTAGALAAACAPAAPEIVEVEKVVEKVVKETVVVEKEVAAKPAEKVTIRFHGRVGVQGDHFIERARLFEADNPNIKIQEELFPGAEYHQKLEVLLAGGTVADTFWTVLLSGLYQRYANKGVLLALDDLIAEDGYDLGVFYPQTLEATEFKGKIYSLAWICHPGRVGCYYNKTLLEEAGVDLPPEDGEWDYDDLVEKAKALTADTTGDGKIDQFGFLPVTVIWGVLNWIRGFGGEIFSEDGNKCVMDSPETMEAIQFLYDLYHTHKVAPTPEQVIDRMFETGKMAMYQSGYWGISARARVGDRFEMGCAPLPKGPAGVPGSMYEFDPICIYSNTKHPDEAFEFVKWMANQETGIRIAEVGSVPGARPDVWENPRLTKDPMHNVFKKLMDEVLPFRGPGNFRGLEVRDVFNQGVAAIWLGKGTPQELMPDITKAMQEVLDKPAE